jgi:F-type H+-transporting ATPase subunit delta
LSLAVAQRYAEALADVATEQKNPERIRTELSWVVDAYQESEDLRHLLSSPAIDHQHKQAVIDKLAAKMALSDTLRNFLLVLTDHRRAELLEIIQRAFDAELNAREEVAEAYVTSARDLSDAEKSQLLRTFEKLTKKKIQAHFWTDPALVGGAIVQIGSTIYDGSVRDQLERMREKLSSE